MAPGRVVAKDCDLLLVGSCVYVRPLGDRNLSSYVPWKSARVSVSSSSNVDGNVRVSRIAEAKCSWGLGFPAEKDALRVGTLWGRPPRVWMDEDEESRWGAFSQEDPAPPLPPPPPDPWKVFWAERKSLTP